MTGFLFKNVRGETAHVGNWVAEDWRQAMALASKIKLELEFRKGNAWIREYLDMARLLARWWQLKFKIHGLDHGFNATWLLRPFAILTAFLLESWWFLETTFAQKRRIKSEWRAVFVSYSIFSFVADPLLVFDMEKHGTDCVIFKNVVLIWTLGAMRSW